MACLIAAPCSGSGKTLLSLCLVALARERGERLQPFKVGPDYLDSQLLAAVAGRPCRNLDPILCGSHWLQSCFHWHGSQADRVLVEGVMGLFDGRGCSGEGSSAAVADQLQLPVVLVVDASRQASSLAALVRGFRDHGPPSIHLAGVVLNRVNSARHRSLLAEALASISVPLLGALPDDGALRIPSRHLGLLLPEELHDLRERLPRWADLARRHLDIDRFWALLEPPTGAAAADPISQVIGPRAGQSEPRAIAVAADAAFHFRYPETTELLQAAGVEPVLWSPLADEVIPSRCRGVLLPGGYPELHAERLESCRQSLHSLAAAACRGLPIVAECGGMMLLGTSLEDGNGTHRKMAGVLPFHARRGELSLGYREARAVGDSLLVRHGEVVVGHEFHRWQISVATKPAITAMNETTCLWDVSGWGIPSRLEGWGSPRLHASWMHLHWAGHGKLLNRFVKQLDDHPT